MKSEEEEEDEGKYIAAHSLVKKRVSKAATKLSESNDMMIPKKDTKSAVKKEGGDTG